jgi:GxxExxY protein
VRKQPRRDTTRHDNCKGHCREIGFFRGDILVAEKVLLELKTTPKMEAVHEAQLLNGMTATRARVGYLLNFGPRGEFRRYVLY